MVSHGTIVTGIRIRAETLARALALPLAFGASTLIAATPAAGQQNLPSVSVQANAEQLVVGLQHPWSIAFLPDDEGALITERTGQLRLWKQSGLSAPLAG